MYFLHHKIALDAGNYIKIIFLALHTHQKSCSIFRLCCSLTAKPLQNFPLLCQGELKPQQSIRSFLGLIAGQMWIFPLKRSAELISQHLGVSISVLLLTPGHWHVGDGINCELLQAPVSRGGYSTTWASMVSETTVPQPLCPPQDWI